MHSITCSQAPEHNSGPRVRWVTHGHLSMSSTTASSYRHRGQLLLPIQQGFLIIRAFLWLTSFIVLKCKAQHICLYNKNSSSHRLYVSVQSVCASQKHPVPVLHVHELGCRGLEREQFPCCITHGSVLDKGWGLWTPSDYLNGSLGNMLFKRQKTEK